jgi:hypothetical protein
MGKEVYIYEVNFDLLSRHVPGFMEGQRELDALQEKITLVPKALTVQDYNQLIDFLHDHVLSEDHFVEELEELGIKNLQTLHPTYLAVVFMDLLRDLLPEASAYNEIDLYKLSKEELLLLTEVLMLYQELFEQYDDAESARVFDISPAVREKFTMAGKQLLEREIESRKTLGEEYSGKWFPQYFHFFMGIDPQGVRTAILKGKGDAYLVSDSY